jgi:hypothetical protein
MSCYYDKCTERDGRKGPPAGDKARCNRTNSPHSKATQRKAKPNQHPKPTNRAQDNIIHIILLRRDARQALQACLSHVSKLLNA